MKKKKGFTLIELIAVVAILAVLAAVAIPRVISYVEKSKKVAIQTEAKSLYNAIEEAYSDGLIKPNKDNVYVWRDNNNVPLKNEDIIFDNMIIFREDICKENTKPIIDILEKNNIVSEKDGKKYSEKLGSAYTIILLKQLINADADKIVLDKNGNLANWEGNPVKDKVDNQSN